MNLSKTLTTAATAAALVGAIGLAYAQTTDTSPRPQQTPVPADAATQPQTTTPGTMQTTPSAPASTPNSTDTGSTTMPPATSSSPSSTDSMATERAAQADRN